MRTAKLPSPPVIATLLLLGLVLVTVIPGWIFRPKPGRFPDFFPMIVAILIGLALYWLVITIICFAYMRKKAGTTDFRLLMRQKLYEENDPRLDIFFGPLFILLGVSAVSAQVVLATLDKAPTARGIHVFLVLGFSSFIALGILRLRGSPKKPGS